MIEQKLAKRENNTFVPDWSSIKGFLTEDKEKNNSLLLNCLLCKVGIYEELEEQGRLIIKAAPEENTCGTCANFRRRPGHSSGTCAVRKHLNQYGREIGPVLYVTQSRKACKKDYIPMELHSGVSFHGISAEFPQNMEV